MCPVLVGTAAARRSGPRRPPWSWLALQVGVNYANDYSDGLRGTDTPARLGPAR